jgi:hypothetical protein
VYWDAACRIWTPEFWTSRSTVIFNFTGFLDYDSGIPRYEWGLGSQQGKVDVVPWMGMTANRVLKDVRFNGGTQKMMVTYVVSSCGPAPACKTAIFCILSHCRRGVQRVLRCCRMPAWQLCLCGSTNGRVGSDGLACL